MDGCTALYATINREEGVLREMMLNIGKKGSCQNTCFYLVGVMISIMLELGVPKEKLIKTIKKHFLGIKCEIGTSCFNKLGEVLLEEIQREEKSKVSL
jgi:hypothetical protein